MSRPCLSDKVTVKIKWNFSYFLGYQAGKNITYTIVIGIGFNTSNPQKSNTVAPPYSTGQRDQPDKT